MARQVRMLMTVRPDFPLDMILSMFGQVVPVAIEGRVYEVKTYRDGSVAAHVDGYLFGLKPHEFEFVDRSLIPDPAPPRPGAGVDGSTIVKGKGGSR